MLASSPNNIQLFVIICYLIVLSTSPNTIDVPPDTTGQSQTTERSGIDGGLQETTMSSMSEAKTSCFQSRGWLMTEFTALFIAFPVTFTFVLRTHSPVPFLLVFGAGATVYLVLHPGYANRSFYDLKQTIVQLPRIGLLFLLSGALLFLFVWVGYREWLFDCPIRHRQVWISILWTYTLFAVYPQEVIYRGFFFHRYRHLFTNQRQRMHASAIAFSFAHLIYYHHYSILFSLIGGYLFAHTYQKSRSLIAVSIEHALYGCFMFTIGLGRFFYTGFDQLLQ